MGREKQIKLRVRRWGEGCIRYNCCGFLDGNPFFYISKYEFFEANGKNKKQTSRTVVTGGINRIILHFPHATADEHEHTRAHKLKFCARRQPLILISVLIQAAQHNAMGSE